MSFFGKLKERLFKSSSKLEDGLEAIVADGGEEEELSSAPVADMVDTAAAPLRAEPVAQTPEPAPEPDVPQPPVETPEPDLPEPTRPPVEDPPAPEPEPDLPPVETPQPDPGPEPDLPELPGDAPEPDIPQPPLETPEPDLPVELPPATPDPIAPQTLSEAPPPADIPRAEVPADLDVAEALGSAPAAPAPAKPGFLGRLLGRGEKQVVVRRTLDDDMLESLEELLIASDMGVDTALRVTANMAEGRYGRKFSVDEIKEVLATEIARVMEPVARPMPIYPKRPQVVLVVGVNGSGKTTTIGKLASQFRAAGKSVVIAAGDTFRAAAVEQLKVWGERAGVPVMTAAQGSDPASLAFDAMERAARDGADLLMIDTAGRLQNRADLMEELSKIVRVIRKKDPDAPHNTLLVLDATTGQNALSQVETFQRLADVSGLVMTKLDGTAKGGVLVALADKFGLPIHAIGVGEQIDDLAPFDPQDFAAALTGLERAA